MQNETIVLSSIDPEKSVETISKFINNIIIQSHSDGLVVGLSGGIDSSVVAYISARAVNDDNILGLIMPSKTTPTEDVEDAKLVAENLGIKKKVINIDNVLNQFLKLNIHSNSDKEIKTAQANLKARLRMMILYYHANSMNRLVLGTGNKSELKVGYFTKYGDGGVDLLPLGDLYKTDVQKIAKYLEIPENIINKPPSAGLWHGQTDEEEMGISYLLLDKILHLLLDQNLNVDRVADELEISEKEVLRIKSMMAAAEHKLVPPPILEIRRR